MFNHQFHKLQQISYGRFTKKGKAECELDLFLMQADGKIVDPSKQNLLHSRLQMELSRPLRVALVSRGPDTELLVANPIELSGKGRPLVFHDITLALKILNRPIFSVLTYLHSPVAFVFERIFFHSAHKHTNGSCSSITVYFFRVVITIEWGISYMPYH